MLIFFFLKLSFRDRFLSFSLLTVAFYVTVNDFMKLWLNISRIICLERKILQNVNLISEALLGGV